MIFAGFRSRCTIPRLWAYSTALHTATKLLSNPRIRHTSLGGIAAGTVRLVELPNRLREAMAVNKTHGVVGATILVSSQTVNRHDPRVLQPPGHLRLKEETRPARWLVGVMFLDLLQSHGTVEFLVFGLVDRPEPTLGVEPLARVASIARADPSGRARSACPGSRQVWEDFHGVERSGRRLAGGHEGVK